MDKPFTRLYKPRKALIEKYLKTVENILSDWLRMCWVLLVLLLLLLLLLLFCCLLALAL